MTLYNVQEYIENPFDQNGLDDLKIVVMEANAWESLTKLNKEIILFHFHPFTQH